MTPNEFKWTFMVYMAGDNGKIRRPDGRLLMDSLWKVLASGDIREMQKAGSNGARLRSLPSSMTLSENATYRL